MDRKRYSSVHCVIVLLCLVQGFVGGHLLPQALEDVHAYVQSELQRSQGGGRMAVEGGPQGGPVFHATQTFIGTPITIQKELRFPDQSTSQSQNFAQTVNPQDLPTGLIPPVPLQHPQPQQQQVPQQQTSSSNARPHVIPANVIGPSTFVSDAPRNPLPAPQPQPQQQQQQQYQQQHQHQQRQQQQTQQQQVATPQDSERSKSMQGWFPLDNEGSSLAKGVGVKLEVTEDNKPQPQAQRQNVDPSYRGVGYSVRRPQTQQQSQRQEEDNDIDIVQTNSVKLQDIIVGTKSLDLKERRPSQSGSTPARYPVYPRAQPEAASPKVVIHAQNVIIRGNDENDSPLDITANNSSNTNANPNNVQAIPAYSAVPQLNNFLRDQLRFAAMNQLLQSQVQVNPLEHPLSGQQFPRPLSLREIAAAVRNGQFPTPTEPRQDPLLPQPSLISPTQLQINIPHVVRMNTEQQQVVPDALPLPSVDAQPKFALPGVGLGNLYQNILQQEVQGAGFDPREPVEYALLAALSGQKLKVPTVPKFKSKPHIQSDYGESVAYSGTKDPKNKDKDPIQILSAAPAHGLPAAPNPNLGSLRQMQDQILKQLLLQELQEEVEEQKLRRPQVHQQQQQLLLPVGLQVQKPAIFVPGPVKRPVAYGTNAHPFAYLAEEAAGGSNPEDIAHGLGLDDHIIEETFEYDLPHGANIEDYLRDDGKKLRGLKKRPRGPPRIIYPAGHGHGHGHSHVYEHIPSHHHHHHSHGHGHGGPPEDSNPDLMPLNKDTIMTLGKGLLSSALEFSRHHNPLTVLSRIRSLPPVKVDLYRVPMGVPEGLIEKLPEKWKTGSGGSRSPYGGGRGKRKHLSRKNNPKFY